MKQHITTEQLWELAENKEDWDSIVNFNTKANIYFPGGITRHPTFQSCCETTAQQVTIGKMIEILSNSEFGFPRIGLSESRHRDEVIVVSVLSLNGSKYHGKSFEGDDLVDALWETVKEII